MNFHSTERMERRINERRMITISLRRELGFSRSLRRLGSTSLIIEDDDGYPHLGYPSDYDSVW